MLAEKKKRIVKKVFKVIGCIILFVAVFFGSAVGSIIYTVTKPTASMKVSWDESAGSEYTDLAYDNDYGNCYDLYIPSGLDQDEDQSLVLYIHGGGFTGGSKDSGTVWCKYLATRGYITASANYTVFNDKHSSNVNLMNREIGSCVNAIYEKCEELGYHVTQMATAGDSAGGCLAMLYAYSQPDDAVIPVKFVMEQTGPAHFDPFAWGAEEGDWENAAAFVSLMSGENITAEMMENGEGQPYIDEISPTSYINENTVPTLCGYGLNDKVVPVNLKYRLFEMFDRYHVSYDYIEYTNSNHGMYNDPECQEEYIEKMLWYCKTYFGY